MMYNVPGNVALYKNASQSASPWTDKYLASKMVDGNIYPWSGCPLPVATADDNIWWKIDFGGIYKVSRVIIYNGNTGKYYVILYPTLRYHLSG